MVGVRAVAVAMTLTMAGAAAAQQAADDPYIWLEDVRGEKSMAWAKQENEKTLGALQADPRYKPMYDAALAQLEAKDRIPYVSMSPTGLYNFWQDPDHVRGIYRRTTMASYRTANPQWETVLDIDALAKADGKPWVYQGMSCLMPEQVRCLVFLSEGGTDANIVREFDLRTKSFVEGGFNLPAGKQTVTWEDQDSLLISRDWGAGTMTESGYAFITKRLRRGQSLEQASEIFRGKQSDVSAGAYVIRDSDGRAHWHCHRPRVLPA